MTASVTFQVERFKDFYTELFPLVCEHWTEIALDHEAVPLEPDWERYVKLDEAGSLSVVTARAGAELVGYHIAVISGHLHYKGTLHGVTDVYFLKPEHRKGFTGIRLFKTVGAEMKRLGVVKLITGTKVHLDMGRLLERLGYRETERTYTKIVGS